MERVKRNPLQIDPIDALIGIDDTPEEGIRSIQRKPSIRSIQSIPSKPDIAERPPEEKKRGRGGDASRAGLPEGWTRFSFIVREDHEEKVKALAYWQRQEIKEVMDEIIRQYLSKKSVSLILNEAIEAHNKRRS